MLHASINNRCATQTVEGEGWGNYHPVRETNEILGKWRNDFLCSRWQLVWPDEGILYLFNFPSWHWLSSAVDPGVLERTLGSQPSGAGESAFICKLTTRLEAKLEDGLPKPITATCGRLAQHPRREVPPPRSSWKAHGLLLSGTCRTSQPWQNEKRRQLESL